RAVISAGFVDRQKLNKRETDLCNPINKLPQRADISDSQIILSAQRKKRHENSGDLLFGRQVHRIRRLRRFSQICLSDVSFRNLCKSAKSVDNYPRRTCQSSTSSFGISCRKRDGRWNTS